jgi:hypothetical protein
MFARRKACSLTKTAVPRLLCCSTGQEDAFAQRILDAGGVVIQPLFPWLWAGGEVAAHRSLKGVKTGELLNPTQSGLQVGGPSRTCTDWAADVHCYHHRESAYPAWQP